MPARLEDAPRRDRRRRASRRRRAPPSRGRERLDAPRAGGRRRACSARARGRRGQAHGDDVLDVHRRNCSAIAALKLSSSASVSRALGRLPALARPELGRRAPCPPRARPSRARRARGAAAGRGCGPACRARTRPRPRGSAAGRRRRSARTAASPRSSPRAPPRRASGRGGGTVEERRREDERADRCSRASTSRNRDGKAGAPLRVDRVLELSAEHRAHRVRLVFRLPGFATFSHRAPRRYGTVGSMSTCWPD